MRAHVQGRAEGEEGRIFFLKVLFIYLREGTQAGGVGEEEAGFQWSREPNVGLHPRTLGSCPEPKADAQQLSLPGVPDNPFNVLLGPVS